MSVKRFLEGRLITPLHFDYPKPEKITRSTGNYYWVETPPTLPVIDSEMIKSLPVDELVKTISDLSYYYYSFNVINLQETCPNRKRSAFDLWRHCTYFNPTITMYDVMNSLYKNRGIYFTWFCFTISRRIWKLSVHWYPPTVEMRDPEKLDEYGYKIHEWDTITKESDELKYAEGT